jgi:serine/threonine protein kinase
MVACSSRLTTAPHPIPHFPDLPQVITTLADYHRLGVVHGDIKLTNILVEKLQRVRAILSDLGTLNVLPEGARRVLSR